MSRFYVPPGSIRANKISVTGEEAHHIIDVMRLRPRDRVVTFDGTGKEYTGIIKDVKAKSLTIEIIEERESASGSAIRITLIQALPKKEKMDYIVEKATELGIHSIIPVVTDRTIPKWDESKRALQQDRWRKLAMEASKQCGRVNVPEIGDIAVFRNALKQLAGYDLALVASLSGESVPLKDAVKGFAGKKIVVAIGPEGDFTDEEVGLAKEADFRLISLGARVLKSDTAALAVLAILDYEYSNRQP